MTRNNVGLSLLTLLAASSLIVPAPRAEGQVPPSGPTMAAFIDYLVEQGVPREVAQGPPNLATYQWLFDRLSPPSGQPQGSEARFAKDIGLNQTQMRVLVKFAWIARGMNRAMVADAKESLKRFIKGGEEPQIRPPEEVRTALKRRVVSHMIGLLTLVGELHDELEHQGERLLKAYIKDQTERLIQKAP